MKSFDTSPGRCFSSPQHDDNLLHKSISVDAYTYTNTGKNKLFIIPIHNIIPVTKLKRFLLYLAIAEKEIATKGTGKSRSFTHRIHDHGNFKVERSEHNIMHHHKKNVINSIEH